LEINANDILIGVLTQGSFLQVNKKLLIFTNCDADAILVFTELLSEFNYIKENYKIDSDGYFFCTIDFLESQIGLNYYKQKSAITRLEKYGFISTKNKGLPRKRYIKINAQKVLEIIGANKVIKKEPKLNKDEFYSKLNETLIIGSLQDFRKVTDNMTDPLVFSIYYWTKLYNNFTQKYFQWNSKTVGIFRTWVAQKLKSGPIDYSVFKDFFIKHLMANKPFEGIIQDFFFWSKDQSVKPHSEREENYSELLKEIE